MDEPTRGMEFQLHGLIGLIYEAAMDVDLWPMLLRTLSDVMESAPSGVIAAAGGDSAGRRLERLGGGAEGVLAQGLVELLRPHFGRALEFNRRLDRRRQQSGLLAQLFARFPLALAAVTADGELLEGNPQFEQLLQSDRRLSLQGGRVTFAGGETQLAWSAALNDLAAGRASRVVIPVAQGQDAPLSAMVSAHDCADGEAAGPCLLLSLAAPGLVGQVGERVLAEMFTLTPAEARLLAALVNGSSLEEYCASAGLSRNTARAQLKALFRKTGSRRQGELVRQVLNSPLLLATEPGTGEAPPLVQYREREMQRFRLRDGRWLCYAEYGPEDGQPLLFAHGLTGCRLQTHPDHTVLQQQGIRLLVPDRPGFGLSDFDGGRTILDWADDIQQLLDALGLERVAAMGFSVGGIYAMALARTLAERISRLTLVSPMGHFDKMSELAGMIPRNRMILTLGRRMPAILAPFMQLMVDSLRRDPKRYFDDLLKSLPPFERHYLSHPALKDSLTRAFREATRNGVEGLVYEQMLVSRPWGFSPADVTLPVQLWHGVQDVHVPVAMSRRLAKELPRCEPHLLEDAGHFLFYNRWQQIITCACEVNGE